MDCNSEDAEWVECSVRLGYSEMYGWLDKAELVIEFVGGEKSDEIDLALIRDVDDRFVTGYDFQCGIDHFGPFGLGIVEDYTSVVVVTRTVYPNSKYRAMI
jgi:hypothetical protein